MTERGKVPYGAPTNGLYTFRPYIYRGTGVDTLTPPRYGPAPRRKADPSPPDGRCGKCGYLLRSRNHHWICD
jgi:hypothetical protein